MHDFVKEGEKWLFLNPVWFVFIIYGLALLCLRQDSHRQLSIWQQQYGVSLTLPHSVVWCFDMCSCVSSLSLSPLDIGVHASLRLCHERPNKQHNDNATSSEAVAQQI